MCGGHGKQNNQAPKKEANANMAQKLADVTAQINGLRERTINNNNNQQQYNENGGTQHQNDKNQFEVHFQDDQPAFGIVDNEALNDQDDDDDTFQEGQFFTGLSGFTITSQSTYDND